MSLRRYFTRSNTMTTSRRASRRMLGFDTLEDRLVMTVSLAPIAPPPIQIGKHTYVPLVATDTNNLPVTFSAMSANAGIQASIYTAGRILTLNVSGKDQNGDNFSGNIVLKLFEEKAPLATARIIHLAETGFYNGLTFHRVIKTFMAQGGDPDGDGTGGSGTTFDDEANASLTFNSYGLLAMANSGDDTNDSQFFITDTDTSANFPQNLNFNHTIFGQIVDGLDIFQKIMNTPVTNNGNNEVSKPLTNVIINTATVATTNRYAILDITSTTAVTSPANVTVTVTNSDNETASAVGLVTSKVDTVNDLPFLNNVSNLQGKKNTPIVFTAHATDLENDQLTFEVLRSDFGDLTSSDKVSVSIVRINNTSSKITITPTSEFVGTVALKLVTSETAQRFDSQSFSVTFADAPTITLVPGTGVGAGNTASTDTPTIEIKAPAGSTVKVFLADVQIGTATETSTPGTYRYTFAANKLLLGSNSVTALATTNGVDSVISGALSIYFAPNMQQVYVVPGAAGTQVSLRFDFLAATTGFKNELGYYVVDDLTGKVRGVAPSASNYWSSVASYGSRQVIFSFLAGGSRAAKTVTLPAGTKIAFYLSANAAFNPAKPTNIYSTLKATNKDAIFHAENFTDRTGNRAIYGFEDAWKGGDRDFDDMVFSVRQNSAAPAVGAFAVDAAATGQTVQASFALLPGPTTRYRSIGGEIGIFPVLDALGTISAPTPTDPNRTLKPGDSGYAQVALSLTGKQALYTNGSVPAETTRNVNLTGGSFFGVYYIPRGTSASFLSTNASNAIKPNVPIAYFSFAAANPDAGKEHMRSYGRAGLTRTNAGLTPIANDPVRLHLMGVANGTTNNFSDFILTYSQAVV